MVAADAETLKATATAFRGLKDDLDGDLNNVNGLNVKPGSFEAAYTLKSTVEKRTGEVVTFVEKINEELEDIADRLDKNAKNVTSTENANEWKVKKNMPDSYDKNKSGND
jgi:hypothetical protein